jgi:hypothetical protein
MTHAPTPPLPDAAPPAADESTAPTAAAATETAAPAADAFAAPVPPEACANCGATLPAEPPPAFCPQCGQEARLHPPSAGEFIHEFVGHYIALEGALWRTLKLLFLRPGQLTREYLEGRRRRYVLPLRLYISASFLFFVIVKLAGIGTGPFISVDVEPSQVDPVQQVALAACARGEGCGRFKQWTASRVLRAQEVGYDNTRIAERLVAMAPYAVFAMQPVFAALVGVAYRRRRLPYGAHFVFSLHIHSLWFVGLLLIALLPEGPGGLVLLPMAAYAAVAMHRVYGGPVWDTLLRATALGLVYTAILIATILLLALTALALI